MTRANSRLFSITALALAAATLAAFGPALRGGWIWDDLFLIVHNDGLARLDAARLRWMWTTMYMTAYQPLGWLAWAALRAAFGLSPLAFHAATLALHWACSCGVFAVGLRLCERAGAKRPAAAAFAGALLFCVHPLQAASAAWVTEIPDLASTLLALAAVFVYLGGRSARRIAACTALFAAALLFRWKSISLPLALLLLDWWPLARPLDRKRGQRAWGEKLPLVLVAVLAAIPNSLAKSTTQYRFEPQPGPIARALWLFVEKLVAPVGLLPGYALNAAFDMVRVPGLFAGAFVVLVTVLLVLRRRAWPAALIAWLLYVAALTPPLLTSQLRVVRVYVHYSYLACLPLYLLAGYGLSRLKPRAGAAALALLVAASLPLSRAQSRLWGDGVLFWTRALLLEPRSRDAYDSLSDELARRGRYNDAWFFARSALDFNPENEIAAGNLKAIEHLAPGLKPDIALFWAHASGDALALGRVNDALALGGKALQKKPRLREAHAAMAAALEAAGRTRDAAAHRR